MLYATFTIVEHGHLLNATHTHAPSRWTILPTTGTPSTQAAACKCLPSTPNTQPECSCFDLYACVLKMFCMRDAQSRQKNVRVALPKGYLSFLYVSLIHLHCAPCQTTPSRWSQAVLIKGPLTGRSLGPACRTCMLTGHPEPLGSSLSSACHPVKCVSLVYLRGLQLVHKTASLRGCWLP